METLSATAGAIKVHLLNGCGYKSKLVRENYQFCENKSVQLAAFAHEPLDARSACIAAIDSVRGDPRTEVLAHRELGAPVIFTCTESGVQVWKPGHSSADCTATLEAKDIAGFFSQNQEKLAPSRIYDAKTLGRIPGSSKQLDLVDIGLLPFVENQIGEKLTAKVAEAIGILQAAAKSPQSRNSREWVCKATFRLLAAKILYDKQVRTFRSLDFSDLNDLFHRVHKHYGSEEDIILGRNDEEIHSLETVADLFRRLSSLRNLTTEALADVYERALITKYTRTLRGTHSTPPYLVDYIVWQLAPWISTIDHRALRIFEPACGHAPFLVSAMRLLRTMEIKASSAARSSFFRERLCGVEIDPFALEIARLSLTVADVPNPNGWHALAEGDMFAGSALEVAARVTTVFLANPPFANDSALRLLERTLPHLPEGAVFGVVAPATLLFTQRGTAPDLRKTLLANFQIAETCLFPDNIFRFADQECFVLLGRKIRTVQPLPSLVRCRRVREEDKDLFIDSYQFKSGQDRSCWQTRLMSRPGHVPWIEELYDEVWSWLHNAPLFSSIAEAGQGIAYKRKPKGREARFKTNERSSFAGAIEGFGYSGGNWMIHEQPQLRYLSLDRKRIRRPGTGTDINIPQVVIKRNPIRGIWRIRAFIDERGRPATSSFITVRPHHPATCPLEYLWAICSSPLASAYVYTHSLKRNIQDGDLRQMPVPRASPYQVRRVVAVARAYTNAARQFVENPPPGQGETLSLFAPTPSAGKGGINHVRTLLMRMDAEVLRLYDLPARAERALLDLFNDKARFGVPIEFNRYFLHEDEDRPSVPLYAYLSSTYQRKLHGNSSTLAELDRERYNELYERNDETTLTDDEREELYELQAEVDGEDYARRSIDHGWGSIENEHKHTREELSEIAEQAISRVDPRRLH